MSNVFSKYFICTFVCWNMKKSFAQTMLWNIFLVSYHDKERNSKIQYFKWFAKLVEGWVSPCLRVTVTEYLSLHAYISFSKAVIHKLHISRKTLQYFPLAFHIISYICNLLMKLAAWLFLTFQTRICVFSHLALHSL